MGLNWGWDGFEDGGDEFILPQLNEDVVHASMWFSRKCGRYCDIVASSRPGQLPVSSTHSNFMFRSEHTNQG